MRKGAPQQVGIYRSGGRGTSLYGLSRYVGPKGYSFRTLVLNSRVSYLVQMRCQSFFIHNAAYPTRVAEVSLPFSSKKGQESAVKVLSKFKVPGS